MSDDVPNMQSCPDSRSICSEGSVPSFCSGVKLPFFSIKRKLFDLEFVQIPLNLRIAVARHVLSCHSSFSFLSECDSSCKGSCTSRGPSGCLECAKGYKNMSGYCMGKSKQIPAVQHLLLVKYACNNCYLVYNHLIKQVDFQD